MSDSEVQVTDAGENHEPVETTPLLSQPVSQKPYSIFTKSQKRLIILAAAIASTFSPLSANIYFPALNSIAQDLKVSPSQINLTITTYMVRYPHILSMIHDLESWSNILDMSGSRTYIYGFFSWPGWAPTGIYFLFCGLYRGKYCPCSTTLFPCITHTSRHSELW